MDAKLKIFPDEFLQRLKKIYTPNQLSIVHKGLINPKITTCRVNTLKTSVEKIFAYLKKENIQFHQDSFIKECFYLEKISQKKISQLPIYQKGEIYLQNLSSQIPALILHPKPNDIVLDLCASPGSKTSQMAALMLNKGQLTAVEPDFIRFERLKKNLEHLYCKNTNALNMRGEVFIKKILENNKIFFDKILIDAPCSGEGTFYVHHKAGFSHWSLDFIANMAKLQKKLLSLSIGILKPGGTICYSTCSLSPEENECVIHDVLMRHSNIKPVSLTHYFKYPLFKPCLSFWETNHFSLLKNQAIRILPTNKNEGFFVCLLKKEK